MYVVYGVMGEANGEREKNKKPIEETGGRERMMAAGNARARRQKR